MPMFTELFGLTPEQQWAMTVRDWDLYRSYADNRNKQEG